MKSVTEKQKKNIHFTYEDRLILEYYLNGKSHFPKITNTQKLSEKSIFFCEIYSNFIFLSIIRVCREKFSTWNYFIEV